MEAPAHFRHPATTNLSPEYMIRAFMFDLDGTLVQTEKLKAESYALAVGNLTKGKTRRADVVEHYKQYVGLTRTQIATGIMEHFGLTDVSTDLMSQYKVDKPWKAFVSLRLEYYDDMLSDPNIILDNRWPRSIQLLQIARESGCSTALATMSHRDQATKVLNILGLADAFNSIATVDDVTKGNPDPEIDLLSAHRVSVDPEKCLVIEDSPAGVEAGLNAGMHVVAVATPFTRELLFKSKLLPKQRIVEDHEQLVGTVEALVAELAD